LTGEERRRERGGGDRRLIILWLSVDCQFCGGSKEDSVSSDIGMHQPELDITNHATYSGGAENAGAYHRGGKCRSDKVWKAIRRKYSKVRDEISANSWTSA